MISVPHLHMDRNIKGKKRGNLIRSVPQTCTTLFYCIILYLHEIVVLWYYNLDPLRRSLYIVYHEKKSTTPSQPEIHEREAWYLRSTTFLLSTVVDIFNFVFPISITRHLHAVMITNANVISTKINNIANETLYSQAKNIDLKDHKLRNFGNLNAEPLKYGFHSKKFEVITNVSF